MRRLVGILTCHNRVYGPHDQGAAHSDGENKHVTVVRDTWYKNFNSPDIDVRFFYGRGGTRDPKPDEIFLDCSDAYLDLPEKTQAMFRWAIEHDYDYMLKQDDDVFLYVNRMLAGFQPVDYIGFELEARIGKYASGAAYQVSQKSMEIVANTPWDPNMTRAEDQFVGLTLARNGIKLVHDPRFLCCHCSICLSKYGPKNLITVHTVKSDQMYELMEN